MVLILVYVVMAAIGEVIAFGVGQFFDSMIPSSWSMMVFMGLFFGVLWVAWPVAVFVTERWFVHEKTS
jgi:hypothetical protein